MSNQFPLSGPVTQTWGWWIKSMSQQTGFININNVQSGNPQLEQRIVEEVASYGRQLGWIMEALDVVVRRADMKGRTADDDKALRTLTDFVALVETMKGESSGVERMLDGLRVLKDNDRPAYERNVALIKAGLAEEATSAG